MPELPDLEIFRQNLMKIAINKVIKKTGVNAAKALIGGTENNLKQLTEGEKFTKIDRRGKHLIFKLSNESALIIHLMLRGKFVYTQSQTDHELSNCFWFQFEDGNELKVTDRTRWVKLELVRKSGDQEISKSVSQDFSTSKLLSKLGPEADEIPFEEFRQILKKSRLGRIKPLLMDQKKIAGIGNAYTDEILWKSKIHPNKTASLLSDNEIKALYSNIKKVLEWGIENNKKELGKKLEESKRVWMNVYRKEGKPCPDCKTPIKYTKVNQRDTFYCPKCQGA